MAAIIMQYKGKPCLTIAKDEICTLIGIKRVPPNCTNEIILKHFKSKIMLVFRKENGNTLGWCDRND